MSASTIAHAVSAPTSFAHTVRIFGKETKYEFLKLMRTKSFSLSTIGFPIMFYVLFGIANRNVYAGNLHVAKYMLGGYACFGLIGATLFGIGVGLASERAAGWGLPVLYTDRLESSSDDTVSDPGQPGSESTASTK